MSTINISLEKSTRSRWLIVIVLLLTVAVALVAWLASRTTIDGPTGEANRPQAIWQTQDIESYRYALTVAGPIGKLSITGKQPLGPPD